MDLLIAEGLRPPALSVIDDEVDRLGALICTYLQSGEPHAKADIITEYFECDWGSCIRYHIVCSVVVRRSLLPSTV